MSEALESKKICELCGNDCTNKRMNAHHLNYELNKTILICFNCHQIVHCRKVWHNQWEKLYGKTWMNEFSRKFVELYDKKMEMIK